MNGHDKFLIPYPKLRTDRLFLDRCEEGMFDGLSLFLDSGAFSVSTLGGTIDVFDYGRWLSEHQLKFEVYANLDVIGHGKESAEGTWRNQRILEDEFGLSPLPVFHSGEDWSVLERYLEAGYGYIALGGLVGKNISDLMPWLIRCFEMAEGSAVFHGFGMTSLRALLAFPWYSVDSSSWSAGWRYGDYIIYENGVAVCWPKRTVMSREFRRVVREYGLEPNDVEYPGSKDHPGYQQWRSTAERFMSSAWHDSEIWFRRRWGLVTRPDNVLSPGLNLYLVAGGFKQVIACMMPEGVAHV